VNIVIYARYSSSSQNEQSIEGQLKVCYEYAERNGYKVMTEYIDRAISGGAADNRPEFLRMIADSVKRQFSAVLVYQLDRFARNRYDSATYKAKLKKNGVRVLSARENISDDASGVLMEAVLEGMAEYYSKELSQKVRRGLELNAQKCLCTGGGIALGYRVEDKKFLIDEETAPVVKRIFEMYLAGSTMADIIRYLNENQIKTSRGNPYNKNSIRLILTNKRYKGIFTYNDIEIPDGIPRIIDDVTFEQAQILMEKNKKAPARAKAVEDFYLLTTKLFCGHCEAAMTGFSGTSHTGKFHQYYGCVSQRRKGGCKKKSVQKAYIEDLVVQNVLAVLTDENIDRIAQKISDLSLKEGNTDTVKRLKKLIKENETATNNLIKAIETGKAIDIITVQIEKRQSEKLDLESQLVREKMISPTLTFDEVKFFFEKFKGGDVNDNSYRTALIDTFVNKIYLYDGDESHLDIYCNAQDTKITIPLGKPEGSPKGSLVRVTGLEHGIAKNQITKST